MTCFSEGIQKEIETIFNNYCPTETTLTLDATGVNGHVQLIVLSAIGWERLTRLKQVNLISGSCYAYLVYNAINTMGIDGIDNVMRHWDFNVRNNYHQTSFLKTVSKIPKTVSGRGNIFRTGCLEEMLRGTIGESNSEVTLSSLPKNARFWVYNQTRRCNVAFDPNGEHKYFKIAELARSFAAIPKIYGAATIGEEKYIDPVFSGFYANLRYKLKKQAKPGHHIFSNVVFKKRTPEITYIKPHQYGNGKRMIYSDFLKLLFNIPNKKIYQSYQLSKLN